MDRSMEVEVSGIKEVLKELGLVGQRAIKETAKALYSEAEIIMGKAKEIVPVDTGALRASGHVQLPVVNASGVVSVTEGFGGIATAYALKVHEDLQMRHAEGTGPKFLERPFLEQIKGMEGRIAARIRSSVEHK